MGNRGSGVARSRSPGRASRRAVLARAVNLAAAEGLESLSIGGLARSVGMSKSGLYAWFGSKKALQLAVIEAAAGDWNRAVLGDLEATEPGLERLVVTLERWIGHIEARGDLGGSFFAAAAAEFDNRPGPVRDRVAALSSDWLRRIREEAILAVRLGELLPETDPARLAFEVHAFVQQANWAHQLLGDPTAFHRARAAVHDRLRRDATALGARALGRSGPPRKAP